MAHGAIGIASESGEILDQLKRHVYYGKDFDKVNILEEAGDILFYVAQILDACGYKLSDAMQKNIDKLTKRYGDKFTQEAANHRDLEAERIVLER